MIDIEKQTNSTPSSLEPGSEALNAANQAFHDSYDYAVQKVQEKLGTQGHPVLLIEADLAVLLLNGQRHEANILPPMYHSMKSVSHLPFGTYVTLAANGPGTLSDETVTALESQMRLAESLIGFGEQLMASPDVLAHHSDRAEVTFKLLSITIDFINGLLQDRLLNDPALHSFVEQITPLFMDHVRIAAALELDTLHKQMSEWRELMGESEWQELFVVISVGHQARYREVSSQYFHRLLHERESIGAHFESRIVHAESIWDEKAALKLLARHQLDSAASRAFFGNSWRLQEDLMSDAASTYLAVLLSD